MTAFEFSADSLPVGKQPKTLQQQRSENAVRAHLVVGADEDAVVFQRLVSSGPSGLSKLDLSIDVQAGGRLHHVVIADSEFDSDLQETAEIKLGEKSQYTQLRFSGRTNHATAKTKVTHQGQHSTAELYGIQILDGESDVTHHVTVEHEKGENQTKQISKNILSDQSTYNFTGCIRIDQDAQKSDCEQLTQSILLSGFAHVVTQPELEISADDVKAKHGATIGQLMPEHIFYLQSRGLSKEKATSLILRSFVGALVEPIEKQEIKDVLFSEIEKRLSNGSFLGAGASRG